MAVIVAVLGVLIAAIGLMGVVIPRILIALVQYWRGPARLWFAVGIRLFLASCASWSRLTAAPR